MTLLLHFGNEKYFDAIIKHTRFLEVFRDLWYVFFTSQLVKTQGKSLFSYFSVIDLYKTSWPNPLTLEHKSADY